MLKSTHRLLSAVAGGATDAAADIIVRSDGADISTAGPWFMRVTAGRRTF